MASKSARPQDGTTETSRADDTESTNVAASLMQRQMAVAADWMSGVFRAGERLQQVQMHMAQRAALLHSQAADNIRKATSPADLATIQATLCLYQCQEGMRYMQEVMIECAKVGRQVADQLQEARPAPGTEATAQADPMDAAAPILQAWQQVFNGAMHPGSSSTH